jgi:PAT family beta-lactamase induction signal transducer AmpG
MKDLIKVFSSFRMAMVTLLGFSCGIPLGLTGGTLQAWMASEKVDLTVIGIFALVGLPYTLKFLWAPLMDRFVPPFLGRRRGWMLISQIALVLGIALMGFTNPVESPLKMAVFAFFVAFLSASQDIVVDAYRTEALSAEERGAGTAVYIFGYRMAMLVSGAIALMLSDQMPWSQVYLIMASFMAVGIIAACFAPEPTTKATPPKTLQEAVILPFVEYFRRKGAFEILFFILLYKMGDVMAGMMTTPMMIDLGFTRTDIGAVNKGFGMFATIIGALFGGALLSKMGLKRSLFVFGIGQAVSNLSFAILASVGNNYTIMVSAIAIENLCGGMGTAAFSAFMMSLCNQKFTATQFALLSSLMAVTRTVISTPSGAMAKSMGFELYFYATVAMAIPGLIMLSRYNRWQKLEEN